MIRITRAEFITLLGGATAWSLSARAQQGRSARIGALVLTTADAESLGKELREGLRELGYVEGRNFTLELRSAEGSADRQPEDCEGHGAHDPGIISAARGRANRMRRRAFITLLGGAAAWPLTARAQQSQRIRRVGVLMAVAESDADVRSGVAIFQQSLQELGWTDGRNLRIDYRWG